MAKQSFKRYISKLFQVAGVRVETDFANMQDNDFVVISRNLSGKTSSRQTVGDQQFYVRWDDFVAFLQGATTDKFIDQVTLVGTTLNFGYNNGDPGIAVILDPLGIITGISFNTPNITFTRPGGDFVINISTILNSAIVSAALVGTALRFTLGNTSTFDVELSSLQDGVVTGGSLVVDDLILTRSIGGNVAGIDISGIKDGVVDGGSVSGTDLILTRTIPGDITIDLAPAISTSTVQILTVSYSANEVRNMNTGNRSVFLDNAALGTSKAVHIISFLCYNDGVQQYSNVIDLQLSMTANTGFGGGPTLATLNFNPAGDADRYSQTSLIDNGNVIRRDSTFDLRIHHTANLSGDNGSGLTVSMIYNLVS